MGEPSSYGIVGEQETPQYMFSNSGTFQPKIDAFRAYSSFLESIPEIESIGESVDTAIMYGSTVRGHCILPDCEDAEVESDIDVLLTLETDDLEESKNNIRKNFTEASAKIADINLDIQEAESMKKFLNDVAKSEPDEARDLALPISYFYEGETSAPRRLRAFGEGFVVHPDYRGEVLDSVNRALENISESGSPAPELRDEYWKNSRDHSQRERVLEL